MAQKNDGSTNELRKCPEEIPLAAKIENIRQSHHAASVPGFGRPDIDVPSQARKCHSCRINIWDCNRAKPSCSDCTQLGAKCQYPTTPPKSGSPCNQCEDLNVTCNQEMPSCLSCAKLRRQCSYWPENTIPLGSTASIYQKSQSLFVASRPVSKTEATLLVETPRAACHNCRRRFTRCNKQWPNCLSCREKDIICRYTRKQKSQHPNPPLPTTLRSETSELEIAIEGAGNNCSRCSRSKVKCSGDKPKCKACASSGKYCCYQSPESLSQQDSAAHLTHWSQDEREHAYDMYHMGVDQVSANKQWVRGAPAEDLGTLGTAFQGLENLVGIPKVDIQGPKRKPNAMPQHFIGDFAPMEQQQPIGSERVSSTLTRIGKSGEEALFNIIPFTPESSAPSATREAIIAAEENGLCLSKRETKDLVKKSSSEGYKKRNSHATGDRPENAENENVTSPSEQNTDPRDLPSTSKFSTGLPIIQKSRDKESESHRNKQKRRKRAKRALSQASTDSWEVLERDENVSDSWDEC